MTYREWFQAIVFLKDKIILPDGTRISKDRWITNKGFQFDSFNKFLMNTYNELHKG